MHILTCLPSYVPDVGGAELGVHAILREIARSPLHRVSVVSATTDPALPTCEEVDGVTIHRYLHPRRWVRWWAPTLSAYRHLPAILDLAEPDIVHAFYVLPTGMAAARWTRRRGVPLVVSLVGSDVSDPIAPPPALLRALSRRVIGRATKVVANSAAVSDALVRGGFSVPEVILLGVDTRRFTPGSGEVGRRMLGMSDDAPLVIALQRLEPRKGVDDLLRAFSLVVADVPRARLVILGEGRERPVLEELTKQLGLQSAVTFAGHVHEEAKPAIYRAADAFALASLHEGLGLVLAEAAASGVAVVSTANGGSSDLVIDGVTGRLVPVGNPILLSRALIEVLTAPDLAQEWGQAGRRHIVRSADVGLAARRYVDIFTRAAS